MVQLAVMWMQYYTDVKLRINIVILKDLNLTHVQRYLNKRTGVALCSKFVVFHLKDKKKKLTLNVYIQYSTRSGINIQLYRVHLISL